MYGAVQFCGACKCMCNTILVSNDLLKICSLAVDNNANSE